MEKWTELKLWSLLSGLRHQMWTNNFMMLNAPAIKQLVSDHLSTEMIFNE